MSDILKWKKKKQNLLFWLDYKKFKLLFKQTQYFQCSSLITLYAFSCNYQICFIEDLF